MGIVLELYAAGAPRVDFFKGSFDPNPVCVFHGFPRRRNQRAWQNDFNFAGVVGTGRLQNRPHSMACFVPMAIRINAPVLPI